MTGSWLSRMTLMLAAAVLFVSLRAEAPFGTRSKSADEEAGGTGTEADSAGKLETGDDLEKAIRAKRAGFQSAKKSRSDILEEGGLTLEEWEREKAAQAQMRIAKVDLPQDLLLDYDWSLPFGPAIKKDGIWVRKDIILVLTRDNSLYSIDRLAGKVQWQVVLNARPSYPPAVTPNAVYVVVNNYIVAIDKVQGQVIWRRQPDFPISAAPLVIEPNIYIPSWDGKFYCLEIKRREKVYVRGSTEDTTFKAYEYELHYRWHYTTRGHIVAAATTREGVLYFGSEDGFMYSISRDGELRYMFQTQGKIVASPDTNPNTVFVGATDFNLYFVDRLTGDEKWRLPAGGDLRVSPVADGSKYVYVPVLNEGYYALNAVTGRKQWHIVEAVDIAGISPDRVYLFLTNNRLAAVEKEKGRVTWISLLEGFDFGISSPNRWQEADDPMRVYLVSKNNVLVSLKEPERLFKGEQTK